MARFFADVALGSKRGRTPEGFLVVQDVPIARTGVQLYAAGEIRGAQPGRDGLIVAERRAEDVFRPETLASFEGKPVTDDHPFEMLNPQNARLHIVGATINPRRGDGATADCIVADVVLYDAATIAKVKAGKVQVSCGYDADYENLGPGRVRQKNIVGNHLAIVDRARCGTLCSFGDTAMPGTLVTTAERKPFKDTARAIRKAFYTQDEDALEAAIAEAMEEAAEEAQENVAEAAVAMAAQAAGEAAAAQVIADATEAAAEEVVAAAETPAGDPVMDALTKVLARLDALEAKPAVVVNTTTVKDAAAAPTQAVASAEMQDTRSKAEILHPGVKLPTLDAAASPQATMDAACALRRKTLLLASESDTAAGKIVAAILGKRALDGMPCADAKQVFDTAATLMVEKNRTATAGIVTSTRHVPDPGVKTATASPSRSNAETNKANAARWAKKPSTSK